ncbi:hypothetical protein KIN20_029968 [Parelaphostrongylus tenuis]|uniref:TGF-beta family profile domain-containing protein n=1 Tax=Parelaphostrongylus tenuis TaxID=148309 RepID=A0AAD5R3D5_PARTN|nr:hypothetical protein KIN20_029968 [Parelaphostrongylus tenuis]
MDTRWPTRFADVLTAEHYKRMRNNLHKSDTKAANLSVKSTTESAPNGMKPYRQFIQENTQSSRKAKVRGRRNKSSKEDIWHGFGEEEEDEKVTKRLPKSNDIRVVLQEAEESDARCQKRGTVLDMKDLGWEKWIIAPSAFEAGFCSGKCPNPLPKEMHPSNHALLQSLLHSSAVPAVCCSPENMRSMTLFYRDELGRSTIKNFESMIVESCTCQ